MQQVLISRLLVVFISTFTLAFILFPISSTQAQTSDCVNEPGTYSEIQPNKIQMQDGFLSTTQDTNLKDFSIDTGDKYLCGKRATIPTFAIPSYSQIKSIYYDQTKTSIAQKYSLPGGSSQANLDLTSGSLDVLYYIKGDFNINGDIVSGNKTGVIFVDGLVNITANLTYAKNDPNHGLVIIAQKGIRVSPSVTEIDALLMTYDQFCSAWNGACNPDYYISNPLNPNDYLTIYGSLVSLSPTTPPAFVRALKDNIHAAETIEYQAKYLVILRKIFSRTRIIYLDIN